ncbi:hypothetical protein GDO78_009463 [Eleutherodactylus coqui]|uniref:Uncharacterized protein n=1 Tax=Eleutherodactylus coqui TaxID=57060 RepID=A0A8J6K7F5_ELECQ|nr:hypothetical protein GDO78_009463 [Eleutherodactylus coqui]
MQLFGPHLSFLHIPIKHPWIGYCTEWCVERGGLGPAGAVLIKYHLLDNYCITANLLLSSRTGTEKSWLLYETVLGWVDETRGGCGDGDRNWSPAPHSSSPQKTSMPLLVRSQRI